jgi:hypothetical protein
VRHIPAFSLDVILQQRHVVFEGDALDLIQWKIAFHSVTLS